VDFHVLTIFPDMFDSPFRCGVLAKGLENGSILIRIHNIRSFAAEPHRATDDYPYGGGAGMVMKPEPIFAALDAVRAQGVHGPLVFLSPQGEPLSQEMVKELATLPEMVLLCGRYEGVDERVRLACVDREISIGDYIITGGELAAMVLIDAVSRLIPGVLGNQDSPRCESFDKGLLEYPQYTRPAVYRGFAVPEVVLSGHHREIERWRRRQSLRRTFERRPDMLRNASLAPEDRDFLEQLQSGNSPDSSR
jgi:tRNA (guanine37-N1)-methyltransferase